MHIGLSDKVKSIRKQWSRSTPHKAFRVLPHSRSASFLLTSQAVGPYSQAIKANGFIFVSGQMPADNTGKLTTGTVSEKTHKMCQNAKAVLEAAGSGLEKGGESDCVLCKFG